MCVCVRTRVWSTPGTRYVWIDMYGLKWTYCPMVAFSWKWMGRTWPSRKCSGGCLWKRTPCMGGSNWSHLFPPLVQDCLIFNTQPFSRLTRRREKQLVDHLKHLLSSLWNRKRRQEPCLLPSRFWPFVPCEKAPLTGIPLQYLAKIFLSRSSSPPTPLYL